MLDLVSTFVYLTDTNTTPIVELYSCSTLFLLSLYTTLNNFLGKKHVTQTIYLSNKNKAISISTTVHLNLYETAKFFTDMRIRKIIK